MESIRTWSVAVCLAALGCAAMQLLAPKAGTGKIFRLVIATFFLCSLLAPLLALPSWEELDFGGVPEFVTTELLEDTVQQQVERQVQTATRTYLEEALAERGVSAEKIEVDTDISEDGGIYIQRIVVTVDKQTVPVAKLVGEVIGNRLETTVTVESA